MAGSFDEVIREHLELKRRNSHLDGVLPLSDYSAGQAVEGEPEGEGAAFDTAEWKGSKPKRKAETFLESLEDVWSSGPVFDWGDGRPG